MSRAICVVPTLACAGVRLVLQRLVLIGFPMAVPGSKQPLLWPEGLVSGAGVSLNATDVRFVLHGQELFNKHLDFFSSQKPVVTWTVSHLTAGHGSVFTWWCSAARCFTALQYIYACSERPLDVPVLEGCTDGG